MMEVADPDAVHAVRNFIKKELALQLKDDLLAAVSGTDQVATISVQKTWHSSFVPSQTILSLPTL